MDGRKNNGNKGHSTKSKGPDKRQNPFRDAITDACTKEDVVKVLKMLYTQAVEKHSTRAAKIYLEYCLGKPIETKDINIVSEQPLFPDKKY